MSAICLTRNRRHLLPGAITCFLQQTYPCQRRELVVCADSDADVAGLLPDDPSITYVRPARKLAVGPKRNFACQHARGEVLVHFDDDDWSAPGRISEEVGALVAHPEAAVVGYRSVLFFEAATGHLWRYTGGQVYAVGTSLCYRRAWWAAHPFTSRHVGEDNDFVSRARAARALLALPGGEMIVARLHGGNTSAHDTGSKQYRRLPLEALPAEFPR